MSRRRNDRKEFRREEGEERLKHWQRLSPAEQLASLDERLGKDMGATKQRIRLARIIEALKAAKRAAKKALKPKLEAKTR